MLNSATMEHIIEIKQLEKHYTDVKAVNGLSFGVKPGICFGLLGPNGAGKTTTIEMMEGVLEPTAGEILYKGRAIGSQFKNEAGIQFQATSLQEFLTVRETLQLFKNLYAKNLDWDELIELCSLQDLLDRDNKKLSGGQRQRLLLALALVNDPELVFLDEPTTGLDPQARRNFWDLVRLVRSRNKTIILTTHYMEEAFELCDEIVIVDKGQLIAEGSPQVLLKNHFGDSIVQIPQRDMNPGHLGQLELRHEIRGEWIEFQTHDPQKIIEALLKEKVSLTGMRLRAWSLEDLFIHLTGKQLRQ